MSRMTKADWQKVDWSKDNKTLAAELNKSYDTVAKKRWVLKAGASDQRASYSNKGKPNPKLAHGAVNQPLAVQAAMQSDIAGKSANNVHAKEWILVSPDDTVYHTTNLHHFVRNHPHLFAPKDVIWKRQGGGRGTGGEYCNATARLSNVRNGKSSAWKGWRLLKSD